MLYQKTVKPSTLELLKRLSNEPVCNQFALAGGTALALMVGHRISDDLDFFTSDSFDSMALYHSLLAKGYPISNEYLDYSHHTLNTYIDDIKVQFLGHIHHQVVPIIEIEQIRLYDLPDIAAMKLNAICNRGSKKDFWDYIELLDKYTLSQQLDFFEKKYALKNTSFILKSLTYFDDADKEMPPKCLKQRKWPDIKKQIIASVKSYVYNK